MNPSNDGSGAASDDDDPREVDVSHLEDVDDGCGCAEVWEELSERRHGPD